MSHRARFQVQRQDAPVVYAIHARQYHTNQPIIQTYAQRLQAEERRRAEATEAEEQRLALVRETHADVNARLRAAGDRRVFNRNAKDAQQHADKAKAKADRERNIEAAREAAAKAFTQAVDRRCFSDRFSDAYLVITGRNYPN